MLLGHHKRRRHRKPDPLPAGDLSPGQTQAALVEFSLQQGIYIDQIARKITPMVRGKPLLKDCSACGTKRVYHPGGRWMNCTNNTEEDVSQHSWSRYLPVFTESFHGCIAIGVCGGGCIADAKALNPGGFDERYCESTRAIVRSVLEHCESDERLQVTNRALLGEVYAHLVQGAGGDAASPMRRSVGHEAVEAETGSADDDLLGRLLANTRPPDPGPAPRVEVDVLSAIGS
jgi:hypothetical protein